MANLKVYFGKATEDIKVCTRMKSIVKRAIDLTLAYEGFEGKAEVSVTFCDNAYIRELNRDYRGKDKATDVLSFPQFEGMEIPLDSHEILPLGDIVISLERAKEQAQEVGNTYHGEVAFLAIHSTLHLLGYDHELSPEDEEDMCARQRDIVAILNNQYQD